MKHYKLTLKGLLHKRTEEDIEDILSCIKVYLFNTNNNAIVFNTEHPTGHFINVEFKKEKK